LNKRIEELSQVVEGAEARYEALRVHAEEKLER
jgi:hypothetical protein